MIRYTFVFLLGGALACAEADNLDAVAMSFMDALEAKDHAAVTTVSSPDLRAILTPAHFGEIAWFTEANFGALQSKTGTAISLKAGGPHTRSWDAQFALANAPVNWTFDPSEEDLKVSGFQIVQSPDLVDARDPTVTLQISEGETVYQQVETAIEGFFQCFKGAKPELCPETMTEDLMRQFEPPQGIETIKQFQTRVTEMYGPIGHVELGDAYQSPQRYIHAIASVELGDRYRPVELMFVVQPGPLKLSAFEFLTETDPRLTFEPDNEPPQERIDAVIDQIRDDAAGSP